MQTGHQWKKFPRELKVDPDGPPFFRLSDSVQMQNTERGVSDATQSLSSRVKALLRLDAFQSRIYRGIAQLVEQRSPKPRAEGSSPSAPATNKSLKMA